MWHQWLNLNFMKLQEYFLSTKKIKIKALFNNFFSFMSVFDAHSQKYHNVTILTMSLLPFWALNVVVALLYMQGQKVNENEWRSYGFGMTWEWVINDRIFIIGWTIPLNVCFGPVIICGCIYEADDTQSNCWPILPGKFFEQSCLGPFPLRMGNTFRSGYFRSVVGPVSHLVSHWRQHLLKIKKFPCV